MTVDDALSWFDNAPMIPKRLLKRLSVKQLREAIRIKSGMQKVERLEQ